MYILTHSNLVPSVRSLVEEIEKLSGERLRIRTGFPLKGKVAIRWGNSAYAQNGVIDTNINSPMLVSVMANKLAFSNKYKDKFWVPLFHKDEPAMTDYPILIRRKMEGMGGEGIVPVSNPKEFKKLWDGNGYWTPYVCLTSEFRVHMFDGDILRIMKKVKEEGTPERDFNIRNASKGWHFKPIEREDSLSQLKSLAKEFWTATKKLFKVEHGFIALDVGWNPTNKEYFILEGNSAPGIKDNPNTRLLYAKKFVDILNL